MRLRKRRSEIDTDSTKTTEDTTTGTSDQSAFSSEKKLVKKLSGGNNKQPAHHAVAAAKAAKTKSPLNKLIVRVIMGLIMIGTFGLILYGGHMYVWLMVVILQILLFRELVNVRYRAAAEKNIPWFRSVQVPYCTISYRILSYRLSNILYLCIYI
jgi:Flp pilus assembly protein TadB